MAVLKQTRQRLLLHSDEAGYPPLDRNTAAARLAA